MMPSFGTPLRELIFQQNTVALQDSAKKMILDSIRNWEPRIVVRSLQVTNTENGNPSLLKNSIEDYQNNPYILLINLQYSILTNIQGIQKLILQVPLAGGTNA